MIFFPSTIPDSEQEIQISAVTVHKNYNSVTGTNDIALVKLSEEARYSEFVTPACLPSPGEELKEGTTCTVTGMMNTLFIMRTILYEHRGSKSPKIKSKLRTIPASEF